MTIAAPGYANASLSGRELALQRRQAMARQGKAAIVKPKAPAPYGSAGGVMDATASNARRSAQAPASATTSTTPALPAAAVSPARARRQALSSDGKAALHTASA